MRNPYYTPVTKMSDILKANIRRPTLFNLFEIEYSFNDDDLSAKEICHIYKANLDIFLCICNIYTFDDYILEDHIPDEFPVDEAMNYITKALDYFIRVNIAQIKTDYLEIKPVLINYYHSLAKLFNAFFDTVNENISSYHKIFEQYRKYPQSVTFEQIRYTIDLDMKTNEIMDALIKYLSEMHASEEYRLHADHLKFYLIFLRGDFNRHQTFSNATLKRLKTK